ncbi:MAG: hypothetical protein JXA20_16355 [Spirochaetes bacterium]|nr:hypothetical protein [Spirochaetota bacterium]
MEEATTSVQQRIAGTTSVLHRDGEKNTPQQKHEERQGGQEQGPPSPHREAKNHVADLVRAVDMANLYLLEKNSPYRFGIGLDGEDLIIEIEFTGGRSGTVKKNITHEDFLDIIDHISGGEGLLYDTLF